MRLLGKSAKKLNNPRGTTLAETLAAFMIIVLALTMLGNVIVQACNVVKVNEKTQSRNQRVLENYWKTAAPTAATSQTLVFKNGGESGSESITISGVSLNEYEYKEESYTSAVYDMTK